MAKLEIELSEYDAMREARKAAEARVEELKQENKDLRGSSKVIIRRETKYLSPNIDNTELLYAIERKLPVKYWNEVSYMTLASICASALKEVPKHYSAIIPMDVDLPAKTDTLVGFEDIRLKVEDIFKEQFEEEHKQALAQLQSEKENYEKKRAQISEKLTKEFEVKINSLKEESERLKKDNDDLFKKLTEASKSHEEKLAEAEKKVREAQEELSKLQGRKKHWWQK